MASVNALMTQAMNNPTVLIAGLAVGYIGAKLQNKFGSSGNQFGGM
jgi:short-subunit dehydrogenase involved in D-alanine esterification of teichoic acids